MNTITINGMTIQTHGCNVSINNGRVLVDGNEIRVGNPHNIVKEYRVESVNNKKRLVKE